uniref:Uncharacterized protein n=1 Tax=viral metagenome TaxID=1070528 RepID=A0A6C0D4U1_9ZZZZ
MKRILLQFIPIVLLFVLLAYFKDTAYFSRTILGKFIAICIIIFYATIDKLYGLLVCALIIIYYQSDFIENMLNYGGDWATFDSIVSLDNTDDGMYIGGTINNKLESFIQINDAYPESKKIISNDAFKNDHCVNGQLMDKNTPVRLDMTEHVFPEVTFKQGPCNTCSKTCDYSITDNKIQKEIDMKPIYSKNQ